MGCGDIIVELYGVDRFIADIDRDREFWREATSAAGTSIVGSILDWVAGPGFQTFFERFDWDWISAAQFRQRHLINGIAELLGRR